MPNRNCFFTIRIRTLNIITLTIKDIAYILELHFES